MGFSKNEDGILLCLIIYLTMEGSNCSDWKSRGEDDAALHPRLGDFKRGLPASRLALTRFTQISSKGLENESPPQGGGDPP